MSKLYIVATPIGNLTDITLRAIGTLKEVSFIACEDTRVTAKLLNHYQIKKPLISYHQHSKVSRVEKILEHLRNGKSVALVTDAGTPGISDPGGKLVEQVVNEGVEVVPIPGPSALTALISVSGIDMSKFVFLGFPPHKKGREKFFTELASFSYPVVIYESQHRLIKALEQIEANNEKARVIVGRELTKMFEEVRRGSAGEMIEYFSKKEKIKGELVLIVY